VTQANQPHVVVVGAGAGGDATTTGLRKQGFEGRITLIGSETDRPYERPHLSKQLLLGTSGLDRVFLRPEGEYERLDIAYLSGQTAIGGSVADHTIELDNGRTLDFDFLVLAAGATPRKLPDIPEATNIVTLRSLRDGLTLHHLIQSANRILVLGAGFIGAEVASSARQIGKEVLLVELAPVPLERVLGTDIGSIYAEMHRSHGVDLRTGTGVSRWIVDAGRLTAVELSDSSMVGVDMALIAIGVIPNLDLAREIGLDVGSDSVYVDESLQASPGVYAIGDIAAHQHPVYGRRLRVEHWQVAQRQGTATAMAIADSPVPYTELPWFWSDQYDVNLQYVGNAVGFDRTITRGDIHGPSFSVFYLKDGVLDATLSINDARSGRFSRELIANRVPITPTIEAGLSDPASDLRSVVRG
jgi:3-phenylpropionate/trans-cinnamate dioxygenase ferredoxin reductase subunit